MFPPFVGVGTAGALYAFLLPLFCLQILAIIMIPCLLGGATRPFAVGKAIYCYVLQTLGIILMTLGGLPALYAVMERLLTSYERFTTEIYIALLVVFATGGLTYLWHERMAETIDEASKRVCAVLFWFTFKFVGYILMVVSALSFLLTMLLVRESFANPWWILPVLIFLYGLLLSWCTRFPKGTPQTFQSTTLHSTSVVEPKPAKKAGKGKKK